MIKKIYGNYDEYGWFLLVIYLIIKKSKSYFYIMIKIN